MTTPQHRNPTAVKISLPRYSASATYGLLWERAPKTCAAICAALPMNTTAFHGRNSGDEALLVTPSVLLGVPQDESENATKEHTMNHLYFGLEEAGKSYGGCAPGSSASEICWFYGPAGLAQVRVRNVHVPVPTPRLLCELASLVARRPKDC